MNNIYGFKKKSKVYLRFFKGKLYSEREYNQICYTVGDKNKVSTIENLSIEDIQYYNIERNFYGCQGKIKWKDIFKKLKETTSLYTDISIYLNVFIESRRLWNKRSFKSEIYKVSTFEIYLDKPLKCYFNGYLDRLNEFFEEYNLEQIISQYLNTKKLVLESKCCHLILLPEVSATLIHECIGHNLENDNFNKDNLLTIGKELNKNISLNVFDYGFANQRLLPYACKYDDLFTECVPVQLIKNSFINETINETGASFIGLDGKINIRMRNTLMLPGSQPLRKLDNIPYFSTTGRALVLKSNLIVLEIVSGYIYQNNNIYYVDRCFIVDKSIDIIESMTQIYANDRPYFTSCKKNGSEKFVGMSAPPIEIRANIITKRSEKFKVIEEFLNKHF